MHIHVIFKYIKKNDRNIKAPEESSFDKKHHFIYNNDHMATSSCIMCITRNDISENIKIS